MDLHESGQMYLESILVLSQTKGKVRSIDIVEYMNFSKPSVSRAVGLLKKGGYILVDKDGHINLTETGRQQAEKIYERHRVISDLLMRLGVDEKTASDDACRIEHAISDRSFEAIKDYLVKFGL